MSTEPFTMYSPCGYAIPGLFNTASPIPTCPQCHSMNWQSWKPVAVTGTLRAKSGSVGLDALRRIQDIVKPTSLTMAGPRWDSAMGGNKQRIWEICEAAIAREEATGGR